SAALGLRLAPRLAVAPRHIHCGAAHPAVGQWRVQQGLAPSLAGYGPLQDLPDWAFVDGRPEDEAFARRVAMLEQEMERGRRHWQVQQRQQQETRERKRQHQLQPHLRPPSNLI
uniref:Large ribosomal subunit protein mL52 n=1 Tax=Chelydra serpentina TaxID=8475 RepID=A0A8C3T344_CHESE